MLPFILSVLHFFKFFCLNDILSDTQRDLHIFIYTYLYSYCTALIFAFFFFYCCLSFMWLKMHLTCECVSLSISLCSGAKVDEESQGERRKSPGERPPLCLPKVPADWRPVVHTLPLTLLLLSLLRPTGGPVLSPGAVLTLCCKRNEQWAREKQRLQGNDNLWVTWTVSYFCNSHQEELHATKQYSF